MKEIIKLLVITLFILIFQFELRSHNKNEGLIAFAKIELNTNGAQYPK